ncbi:hypothetical protein EYF80_063295 [Liparis tanakae]|uniref:Uncharacterized protein n=1 Tax=Liparis tanakae TaxID=230148 RepID=A0A4Z2ECL2_9TELE|nr:hypothetical protein EYF80_063295 [Liparis tanakae]
MWTLVKQIKVTPTPSEGDTRIHVLLSLCHWVSRLSSISRHSSSSIPPLAYPSLSLREPHGLVVGVVGRPRPEALIGVEVHGVDFLPANVLKSYSCLRDSETDNHN